MNELILQVSSEPLAQTLEPLVQTLSLSSSILWGVLSITAMLILASLNVRTTYVYIMGECAATAITWILSGDVPLILPAFVIVMLIVFDNLQRGRRSE